MARIAKLTAIDLPLLESVSHDLEYSDFQSALPYTGFLMIPTLKRVSLRSGQSPQVRSSLGGSYIHFAQFEVGFILLFHE